MASQGQPATVGLFEDFHTSNMDPGAERDAVRSSLAEDFDSKSPAEQAQITALLRKCLEQDNRIKEIKAIVERKYREMQELPSDSPAHKIADAQNGVIAQISILQSARREIRVTLSEPGKIPITPKLGSICLESLNTKGRQLFEDFQNDQKMLVHLQQECDTIKKKRGANPRKVFYDAKASIREVKRDESRMLVQQQPFEHNNPPKFPGNWQPARLFGESMASAALWVQLDQDGRISRRVVRKDTRVSLWNWASTVKFAVDPRDPNVRTPMEIHCHMKLQHRPEAKDFVSIVGSETDISRAMYRLYTEYCPNGDLFSIVFKHRDAKGPHIPEAFLWSVFEALVDCGLLMQWGGIHYIPDDWMQVVHRDLKPANVMLDSSDPTNWPMYPQVRLGDFGLAIKTHENDQLNPLVFNLGSGTQGYIPPEQRKYEDQTTGEPVDAFKLLAHTNV